MEKNKIETEVSVIKRDCPWMTDEFAAECAKLTPQQHAENAAKMAEMQDAAWGAIRSGHEEH